MSCSINFWVGLEVHKDTITLSTPPFHRPAVKKPATPYAGSEACKECHLDEYKVWAGSSHARSFVALGTAMGRQIALQCALRGCEVVLNDSRADALSGGQQQRVAIARALISDPTLIVADEPTGDLDRVTAGEILGLLERLNDELGKTILMVTHDPKAAERAHRVVHLEKGVLAD